MLFGGTDFLRHNLRIVVGVFPINLEKDVFFAAHRCRMCCLWVDESCLSQVRWCRFQWRQPTGGSELRAGHGIDLYIYIYVQLGMVYRENNHHLGYITGCLGWVVILFFFLAAVIFGWRDSEFWPKCYSHWKTGVMNSCRVYRSQIDLSTTTGTTRPILSDNFQVGKGPLVKS